MATDEVKGRTAVCNDNRDRRSRSEDSAAQHKTAWHRCSDNV